MAELEWQGLPKDGTKGVMADPVWYPEKVIPTPGTSASRFGTRVRPTLRMSWQLDLGWEEMPTGPKQ